jgi:protease-4
MLRVIRGYLIVVGLAVTLLPLLLAYLILSQGHETKATPGADADVVLAWKLRGEVVSHAPSTWDTLRREFYGDDDLLYLPEIRLALHQAARDAHVKGLFLEFDGLEGSFADLSELRRELAAFRQTGKPLRAHITAANDHIYYLASAAERITLTPVGSLILPGPTFTMMFFGEALRRLGVEVEPLRLGKYKSAIEPFIGNRPSAETIENYTAVQRDLRQHLVESVAVGRGVEPSTVLPWFKESIFTTERAKSLRLVDDIAHPGEAKKAFSKEIKTPTILAFEDWADSHVSQGGRILAPSTALALIEARGEIHLTASGPKAQITPAEIIEEIRWAKDNSAVKAVVMRVDSPGGSATASEVIWRELRDLAAKKPLVVSMGSVAASGGYYIASAAGKILAEPTTITGSIGVFALTGNLARFADKWGISFYSITDSDRAALFNPGQRASEADKQIMSASLKEVYATFLARVVEGRHMDAARVEELAQGRIYTGKQALDAKLVDSLGGLRESFRVAKELAKLDPDKSLPLLRYSDEEAGLSSCLLSPRHVLRCLRRGGASLAAPLLETIPHVTRSESVEALAVRTMGEWLGAYRDDRVLALWPQYISVHP